MGKRRERKQNIQQALHRNDFLILYFQARISLMKVRGDWARTKENEKLCAQRVHMARVKANLLIGINKHWGQRSKQDEIDQKRYKRLIRQRLISKSGGINVNKSASVKKTEVQKTTQCIFINGRDVQVYCVDPVSSHPVRIGPYREA